MLIKVRSAYGDFDLEGCNPEDKGLDLELALEEVLEQKDERLTEYGHNIVANGKLIDLDGQDRDLSLKSLSLHDGDTITILPYRSPAQDSLNHPPLDIDDAAQDAATATQINQAITDLCGGTLPPHRRRRRHRVPTNPNLDGADAVRALMTGDFEQFQNYFQNMSLMSSEEEDMMGDIDMGSALAGLTAAGMGGGGGGAEERLTSMLGALNSIQSIINTTAVAANNSAAAGGGGGEEEEEEDDEEDEDDEDEDDDEEAAQQGMPGDIADMISQVYAALGAGTNPLVTGLGEGGGGGGGINIVRPPLPNEANDRLVTQLIEMGFNRELATNALILNYNRVDPSVEWLLNRMVEPEAALTASSRLIEERREGERRRREEASIGSGGNNNNQQQGEGEEESTNTNAAVGGVDTNQDIPSPASSASSRTTPTATVTATIAPPSQLSPPSSSSEQQQQQQERYEDEISQLVAMGFDSELSRRAMEEYGSLNVAVNALLSGSYSG